MLFKERIKRAGGFNLILVMVAGIIFVILGFAFIPDWHTLSVALTPLPPAFDPAYNMTAMGSVFFIQGIAGRNERRRIMFTSIVIMCAASLLVGGVMLRELYQTALEQERINLMLSLDGRVQHVAGIMRFESLHPPGENPTDGDARDSELMGHIMDALGQAGGFRSTGELILARRQQGAIRLLLHTSTGSPGHVTESILQDSERAEPMHLALEGRSGVMTGPDFRGVTVLAAYRPLKGLGLVEQVELAEVRRPFIRAALIAAGFMVLVIVLGSLAMGVTINPMILRLKKSLVRHQQAEEQLKKLSRVVEQSPVAVMITNLEGHIEYINPRFSSITGFRYDEVEGKTPRILQSGRTSPVVYEELWRTITTGEVWHGELRNRRKDGSEYWASQSISPVRDRGGAITHFVGLQEDVTENKRSERSMLQLNRSLATLSACNEVLVHAQDEETLLSHICRQIVSNTGHPVACVSYLGGKDLIPVASSQDREDLLEHFIATCSDIASPASIAVQTGKAQLVSDIQSGSRGERWRDDASIFGYGAICSLPLVDKGMPFGVLSIYAAGPEDFGQEELPLFSELAEDLAYGIMTLRTRTEWEAMRRKNEYILNAVGEGIYGMDRDGRTTFANPAAERMLGWSVDELLGSHMHDLVHHTREDGTPHPRGECPTHALLQDGCPRHVERDVFHRKDGSRFYTEYTTTPINEDGETIGAVVVFRDITQRIKTQAELNDSRQRFELAVRGTADGLWDWIPDTNEVWLAPRFKELLGYEEHELPSTFEAWEARLHPDDHDQMLSDIHLHLDFNKPFDAECRLRTRHDEYRWFRTRGKAVRDEAGKAVRMAGSIQDITERKQIEEQLLYSALHDALTGLPNRVLLMDRLHHAIKLGKREAENRTTVLFLGLDRFKVINDSQGHQLGDQLLIKVGERLQECMRSGDTVARLGGDEFVMLLGHNCDQSMVFEIADRVQQVVATPLMLGDHEVFTTTSIGIAFPRESYERAEDQLRDADTAMYFAKSRGGDSVEVFEPGMRDGVIRRFSMEHQLRQALEEEQLSLNYQPIVELASGRLKGFEALVRWQHPEKGAVSPEEFIPVAEETGLILPLGHWIIGQACDFMQSCCRQFQDAEELYVSVNLSPRQVGQADLLEDIGNILERTGLSAEKLRIEITENMLMENSGAAKQLLPRLKELGIQLYMDDFGTGYSSLSYLHNFPLDVLKIDRSFINRMDQGSRYLKLVSTIISLARNFDMHIIAEGVETPEQADTLRGLGCNYGQGYHFARPLTEEQVQELLLQQSWTLPVMPRD
ncbi:MAG: EAL domain-containing protein [Candidatus Sedimenticola sp. 20ELBAFRAG]